MPDYLRQRQYKRDGKVTRGAYYYQRRVPKELRHRTDVFTYRFIEVYLGTTDRTVAKRKVSAVNELWERTFDAMRKDETITSQQIERIRLAEQQRVFDTLMEDPYFAGGKLDEYIDSLFPNSIDDARKYLERTGLGQTEQNLNEAARAIWMGTLGAKVLFEQGLQPPTAPAYEPLMVDVMPDGPTLLQAAEAYETAPDVNTTEKTRRQLKQSARLLGDHVGHQKPIVAITGRDAVAFLDRLANISPDYRRDPKPSELTLSRLEEFYYIF